MQLGTPGPEHMPKRMPETMPDKMSNRMSKQYVRVGITRSKVFKHHFFLEVDVNLGSILSENVNYTNYKLGT